MQSRKMADMKPFDMGPYEEEQKEEDERIRAYWQQREEEDRMARQKMMPQSTPSQMQSASSILPGLSSNMPTTPKPSILSRFSSKLNSVFGYKPKPAPPPAAAAAGGYRKTSKGRKGRKGRKTAKKAKNGRKTRKH